MRLSPPPKLTTHYISDLPRRRRNVAPVFLIIPLLLVGISLGSWAVWTSQFGQANKKAQTLPDKAPVPLSFNQSDLNIVSNLLPILIEENRHEPTIEELAAKERRDKLRDYLALQKSPLAKDENALGALLSARNMKMILAISFVESNICKHQSGYNCSGIGGSTLKKYANYAAWINDFDALLDNRYKGLSVEQFVGYYVQPGSQNWIDGVYGILDELKARNIE